MDEQKTNPELDELLGPIVRQATADGNGNLPSIVEEKVQSAYAAIRATPEPKEKKDGKKLNKKKRHTARNWAISLASVAAAFLIFFGIGAANPAWATQIPILGGLFAFFQENSNKERNDEFDNRYFQGDLASTAQRVLASAKNDGLTITVEEASFDGLGLVMSLRATSSDPRLQNYTVLKENPETYDFPTLKLGDQGVVKSKYADGTFSEVPHEITPTSGIVLARQADGSFTGALTFNMSAYTQQFNLELPESGESIPCTLNIPGLVAGNSISSAEELNQNNRKFSGSWGIHFPIRMDTSKNQTMEVNQEVDGCILKTIERTPSSTRVTVLVPKKQVVEATGAISFPYTKTYDEREQELYGDIYNRIQETVEYVSPDHSKFDDMSHDDYVTSVHITPYCPPGKKKIVFAIDHTLAVFHVDIPE